VLNDLNQSNVQNEFLPTPSDSDEQAVMDKLRGISNTMRMEMEMENNLSMPTMNVPHSVPTMTVQSQSVPNGSHHLAALRGPISYPTNSVPLSMSRQMTQSSDHGDGSMRRLSERQSVGSARHSMTRSMEMSSQIKELTRRMSTFTERLSHIQEAERKIAENLQMLEVRRKREDDELGHDADAKGAHSAAALREGHSVDSETTHSPPPPPPESTPPPNRLPPLRQMTEETLDGDSSSRSSPRHLPLDQVQSAHVVIRIDNILAKSKNGKAGRSKSDLIRPVAAMAQPTYSPSPRPSPRQSMHLMQPMRPRMSSSLMTASLETDNHLQHWLEITESASTATTALSALSGQSAIPNAAVSEFREGRRELKRWLVEEVGLAMYYTTFVVNGYESLRFIQDIEIEEELEELGIVLKGHKRRIMTEIDRLKRRNASDFDVEIEDMEDEWRQIEEAEEKAAEEKAHAMGFVATISTMDIVDRIENEEEKVNDEQMAVGIRDEMESVVDSGNVDAVRDEDE